VESEENKEIIYSGIPVSEGVTIAHVLKLDADESSIVRYPISKSKVSEEVSRFENAILETRKELLDVQQKISKAMGENHASIFNAHLLIIEDFTIIEEVIKLITNNLENAEYVFSSVMQKFTKVFNEMEDQYLKERVADIKDVTRRVLSSLDGEKKADIFDPQEDVVILAYDLAPSETTLMHKKHVVGFATDIGGKTSHTAIMARSMGIPAVVGLHDVTKQVKTGTQVILDGNTGRLIVNPTGSTIKKYEDKRSIYEDYEHKLEELKDLEAVTLDGRVIQLNANIEVPEDIVSVLSHGAQGIGLYRTEYNYMNREDIPTEDDLFNLYKQVIDEMKGLPVVFRTMDIGGDKFLCHLNLPVEMNPFLGWRAIRFCLERTDIFKTQIRAILRASAFGNTSIMFPMISNVSEIIRTRQILKKCMKELKVQEIPFDHDIKVGIMVEIPSAALVADVFAKHVDFFSLGTNDLIQYTLAVDRVNEKIAYLYQPLHPAVLKLIANVSEVGINSKTEVHVCGGMASEPDSILFLIGMGLTKFSLAPFSIPKIKKLIRSIKYSETQELVAKLAECGTSEEVEEVVNPILKRVLPNFN